MLSIAGVTVFSQKKWLVDLYAYSCGVLRWFAAAFSTNVCLAYIKTIKIWLLMS